MNLDAVLQEWKKDCEIEFNQLDVSSQETPRLHAKYLELLSNARMKLKEIEFNQKLLLKDKWLYYQGKMSREEIEAKGWNPDPFNGLKILKGELDYYYNSDPEIMKSEAKITYMQELISVLKEIVDNIKWRHSTIGNMIRFRQFEAGF
jgi:hypothetical protein